MKDFKTYFEDFNNWRSPSSVGVGGPNIVDFNTKATPAGFKGQIGGTEPFSFMLPKKKKRFKFKKKKKVIAESNHYEYTLYEPGIWKKVIDRDPPFIVYHNTPEGKNYRTRHRLDGPAYIRDDSTRIKKEYWINGIEYTEKEYWQHPLVKARMELEKQLEKLPPEDKKAALNILDI